MIRVGVVVSDPARRVDWRQLAEQSDGVTGYAWSCGHGNGWPPALAKGLADVDVLVHHCGAQNNEYGSVARLYSAAAPSGVMVLVSGDSKALEEAEVQFRNSPRVCVCALSKFEANLPAFLEAYRASIGSEQGLRRAFEILRGSDPVSDAALRLLAACAPLYLRWLANGREDREGLKTAARQVREDLDAAGSIELDQRMTRALVEAALDGPASVSDDLTDEEYWTMLDGEFDGVPWSDWDHASLPAPRAVPDFVRAVSQVTCLSEWGGYLVAVRRRVLGGSR